MLIYMMGDEADDILKSFKLSEEDAKKYGVVKAKFDNHFVKKRNVIYERAQYPISPPEGFNFSQPKEWPKWIRRFERFRSAAGLTEKDEEVQVNMLIYTMGDEADDIFKSFKLSEEDAKKYGVVKAKFDNHFVKKRNVIYERAKSNSRKQEEGEPVDSFITDLYFLVEHCNYKDFQDEMIRDRLVVGLRDATLSEKLQLDSKLTLEKAVMKVRQAEAVRQQQPIVRGDEAKKPDVPVGAVHHGKSGKGRAPQGLRWRGMASHMNTSEKPACYRCGHTRLIMIGSNAQRRTLYATIVVNEDILSECASPLK